MQFSNFLLVAFIASSASAAVTINVKRDCSLSTCVIDLGGTIASCVSAAASEFLNPFNDGKCVADLTNLGENAIPDSCLPCIS